jgi:hypothetical protein
MGAKASTSLPALPPVYLSSTSLPPVDLSSTSLPPVYLSTSRLPLYPSMYLVYSQPFCLSPVYLSIYLPFHSSLNVTLRIASCLGMNHDKLNKMNYAYQLTTRLTN